MKRNNPVNLFDPEKVARMFERYPEWEKFICAGTISLKTTRELLGIDRYECTAAYQDMMMAGAIYGSGSNMYRATPDLREFVMGRLNNQQSQSTAQ